MNKKVIYLAAILIAAVLIFVSIPQGTEIPFGDENVEGSIILKYYGITEDGKEIEITPSTPLTVWSDGWIITSVICKVTAVVTRTDDFIKQVDIDATGVMCVWDTPNPAGGQILTIASAPIATGIQSVLEYQWVGDQWPIELNSLSTGDLNSFFIAGGYPSFTNRPLFYGLSGPLTWEAFGTGGILVTNGAIEFNGGSQLTISYSQATVIISVTYGPE